MLAILGVTASGKSQLAMALARAHADSARPVELVSVDSMQVYRGMDIGTAKPSKTEQAEVVHHLIDLVDPHEEFTVSAFQQAARSVLADISERGHQAILVGGTGLHLRSIVDDLEIPPQFPEVRAELETVPDTASLHARLVELDPLAAGRMEPSNRRRVVRALEVAIGSGRPFSSFGPGLESYGPTRFRLMGLRWDREAINSRIELRYQLQMEQGFLQEVQRLAARPEGLSRTARQALGYRQLLSHVANEISLPQALDEAVVATRRFARRQERWFRRDPRITWLDVDTKPMEVLPALMRELSLCS